MSRYKNLRGAVIEELLAGNEVCGAILAKRLGCEVESLATVLRKLAPYCSKRRAPDEPGKNRIYYKAKDREALIEIRDRKVKRGFFEIGSVPGMSFDALLNAWGMRITQLDLPVTEHRMTVAEDDELLFG